MMATKGNGYRLGGSTTVVVSETEEQQKQKRLEKEKEKYEKEKQASKTRKWNPDQLFKDLFQKDMIPDSAIVEWNSLGIQLDIKAAKLAMIEKNVTPGDVVVSCRAMLKAWKTRSGKTDVLIQALKACDYIAYVENVVKPDLSGKEKVDDKYLQNIVAPKIASNWRDVAIQLGFSEADNFAQHVNLVGERFRQMLKLWLDSNEAKTLDEVLKVFHQALIDIELIADAEDFLKNSEEYIKSCSAGK